jgi:hypothetical protein
MSCDDVRDLLAEHVLGTLDDVADTAVRRHLRGCAGCRQELRTLEEGVSTFARAAHQVEPPEALRDRVLGVIEEEHVTAPPTTQRRSPLRGRRGIAVAAAVVLLAASAGLAAVEHGRASHFRGIASRYERFLDALGGKDVRVGTLRPLGEQAVDGSVVMYDSDRGQSWILVLVHAPGESGEARVMVRSPQRHIELHPLRFDEAGEASTWLVTRSDISDFDRVQILDASGGVMAAGNARHE